MLKRFETTVRVKGRGATRAQAFADALNGVQRAVMNDGVKVLLRIEPQNVEVVQAEEVQIKERFLFLFLPRIRSKFSVTLDVVVNVTGIDADAVQFDVRQA
ncbi:DUF4312 family protein [Microvirga sp. W0021]|uniref:DUF4312 family protein n=1 Tax=Hohaiivirga grylli TaxID=3133970 RepID=A0ABV0BJ59_9HYPH